MLPPRCALPRDVAALMPPLPQRRVLIVYDADAMPPRAAPHADAMPLILILRACRKDCVYASPRSDADIASPPACRRLIRHYAAMRTPF